MVCYAKWMRARRRPRLGPRDEIEILLEEYRALYGLVTFRMSSLDRRVPVAGATLVAFVGSVPLLPVQTAQVLLLAIPLTLIWFLRTTVNHARSFEDALRRIEHIERAVNRISESDLLGFQSRHPSRGTSIGGRTGTETIEAVVMACGLILASCLFLAFDAVSGLAVYAVYIAFVSGYLIASVLMLRRYRYQPS